MHCRAVQHRIVAWQDDELSPGESVQVAEHLASCSSCAAVEERLRLPPLEDALVIPPEIQARLAAATRADVLIAEARREDRATPFPAEAWWRRWLVDAVEVPGWTVLAAAALLTLTAGWAVQMTLAYSGAQAEAEAAIAARTIPAAGTLETRPGDLPPDQFQPASYQPGEDHGYR